jgi:hypothetical protein
VMTMTFWGILIYIQILIIKFKFKTWLNTIISTVSMAIFPSFCAPLLNHVSSLQRPQRILQLHMCTQWNFCVPLQPTHDWHAPSPQNHSVNWSTPWGESYWQGAHCKVHLMMQHQMWGPSSQTKYTKQVRCFLMLIRPTMS